MREKKAGIRDSSLNESGRSEDKSEECRSRRVFRFLGSGERNSRRIAGFGGDDHLGRPLLNIAVPLQDGVIVDFPSCGDLALQIIILLHDFLNFFVGLKIRISLNRGKDLVLHGIELLAFNVPARIIELPAIAETSDLGESVLVEVDGLVQEFGGVLQNLNALLKIIVDFRSVVLDFLLQGTEVAASIDFHDEENEARKDPKAPQNHLKGRRSAPHFHRKLLLDDVDVSAFVVDRPGNFV